MRAELLDDTIVLEPIGAIEEQLTKDVPGARWTPRGRVWHAPARWPVALALRGIFGAALEMGPALTAWGWEQYARVEYLNHLHAVPDADGDPDLMPYQRVAVDFLKAGKTCLLGDEMRVGKTPPVCVALRELRAFPALVVCPARVMKPWARELARWAPDLTVALARGTATQRRAQLHSGADVTLIAWDNLRYHSRLAPYGNTVLEGCENCVDPERKPNVCHRCPRELNEIAWRAVVADEVHRACKPRNQWTRALWAVSEAAEYRWGLSGTVSPNHADDLWAPLHFTDPAGWPRKTQYLDRYCYTGWNTFGGLVVLGLNPQTRPEFYKAFDPIFLRRTLTEVGLDTPVLLEPQVVELSPKERKAYKEFKAKLILELDDGATVIGWNPLVKTTRLLQLGSGTVTVDDDETVHIVKPSSKAKAFVDWLQDVDEPVVAFFVHRDLLQIVKDELGDRAECLVGGMRAAEADDVVDRFQTGQVPVLLTTYGTGGEGLTLNRARVLVRVERPWSMVQDDQATHRIFGFGQTAEQVRVVDFLAEDTFDERITNAIGEKADQFQEIVRDKDRLRELL